MSNVKLALEPVGGSFVLKGPHLSGPEGRDYLGQHLRGPGEHRLDERQLSEDLGVSRTPIREALCRLEQEGFVRTVPRKGAFIERKSKNEILEMITVWAALESMAARLIHLCSSDEEIATLRQLFATFEGEQVQAHIDEYSETNIEFHQSILRMSGCELLNRIAENSVPAHALDPYANDHRERPCKPVDHRPHAHYRGAGETGRRLSRASRAPAHLGPCQACRARTPATWIDRARRHTLDTKQNCHRRL